MAKLINLGDEQSVFNQFIREIRDVNIQHDRMRFRRNLERIGEVMAYEISKTFAYAAEHVRTPLGDAEVKLPQDEVVICGVLRAGLPLHYGFLNYFDGADNAFVSAYRMHHKDNEFEIKVEYVSGMDLEGKTLIICDPMLATGSSLLLSYRTLVEEYGEPAHLHIASAITSSEGLDYVRDRVPSATTIWVGAIDDELTAQSYIVPGLGDAGDLAFGQKA